MTTGVEALAAGELVFTEPVTYIATPCPDWCTDRPLHRCTDDLGDGRHSRYHQGPTWGQHPITFAIYGEEVTDAPGTAPATASLQLPDDTLDELGPDDLRQIALDALAAAEWLEAHR